ncbi:hypothetical protein POTOM_026306 [Populus tomentosa]|uniref:Uncharacterized protein n=1 Tax=Populus tomentosa TaxID=118781 RepID=A0A8X8CXR7_POPTO|nr:hypothetical protein POTOM_026306 [Populus tomentosa]
MFLNKACVIQNPEEKYLTPDGRASDPWKPCTADEVGELKALIMNEFFYTELPESMSGVASNLFEMGLSAAKVVAS